MKIKISNSKITVAGKTIIDNRGKDDVVLHLVSKSFECCKEGNKCSKQCNDCKMVYNCF